jgi:hypothetical protein
MLSKATLLRKAEAVLYARRSGNLKREQAAWDRLESYCESNGLMDTGAVVADAVIYLAKMKPIASRMGGVA